MLEVLASSHDTMRMFMATLALIGLSVAALGAWSTRTAWRNLAQHRAWSVVGFAGLAVLCGVGLYVLWVIGYLAVGFSRQ